MADGIYCYIDWDGDGDWDSSSEDVSTYLRSYSINRGKDSNMGRALVGTAAITLKDTTGKFVASSTVSPLTGSILPGRKIKIMRTYGGTDYTLFIGYLSDIQNDFSESVKEAYFTCTDGSERLASYEIPYTDSSAPQVDETGDHCMLHILWLLGYSSSIMALSTSKYTYHYVWPFEITGKTAIDRMCDAENAFYYIARAGTHSWEVQDYRATYHAVSEWTCPGTIWRTLKTQNNWHNVINDVIMKTTPHFVEGSTAYVLWECQESLTNQTPRVIPHGTTEYFWANTKDSNGNENMWDGFQVGEFSANHSSDGTGVDCSAALKSLVDFPLIHGPSVQVAVPNSSSNDIWVTRMQLTGTVWADYPGVRVTSHSTASQDIYGLFSKTYDLPWAPSSSEMQVIADNIIANNSSARPSYVVEIVNNSSDALTHALDLDISDRFTIQDSRISLSRDVYIDQVQHSWNVMDGVHHTFWNVTCAT